MNEPMSVRTVRSRRATTVATIGLLLVGAGNLSAEQLEVNVALAQPYLLAGPKQTTYVRVGLTGRRTTASGRRAPVNVAIVLDKSGSMQGEKLSKVKEAALASIGRLGPDDIVSVVAYDHTVHVLAPASRRI